MRSNAIKDLDFRKQAKPIELAQNHSTERRDSARYPELVCSSLTKASPLRTPESPIMLLPSLTLRRTTTTLPTSSSLPTTSCINNQIRHATFLRRPLRPYTFTQLVVLSDGSSYLTRTTSPAAVYRNTKDTRNHPLWQPSLASLRNVENDEAGRLSSFRRRFGRGWDGEVDKEAKEGGGDEKAKDSAMENLTDLIGGGAQKDTESMKGIVRTKSGKGKK